VIVREAPSRGGALCRAALLLAWPLSQLHCDNAFSHVRPIFVDPASLISMGAIGSALSLVSGYLVIPAEEPGPQPKRQPNLEPEERLGGRQSEPISGAGPNCKTAYMLNLDVF
jgi:hypothetical protein